MNNKTICAGELPTLKFNINEMRQPQTQMTPPKTKKIGTLFYLLAALQIFTIFGGAVLALFVAPASLFASRTQADESFAITVGLVGLAAVALGLILILLSLVAAIAFRRDKHWGSVVGFAAAGLGCLEFPFGTILGGYLIWKIINRNKL